MLGFKPDFKLLTFNVVTGWSVREGFQMHSTRRCSLLNYTPDDSLRSSANRQSIYMHSRQDNLNFPFKPS